MNTPDMEWENEFENYIYELYQQYFSLEEKGLVPTTTHCVTDSVNFEEIVAKHKDILHQQLQKVREERDTYWKERVYGVVSEWVTHNAKTIQHNNGETEYVEVRELLTLLDNLK